MSATQTDAQLRWGARALYLVVFTSGAVLMGLQIAGSRIMAPSFGTAIFVWGSLLTLFPAAMSLGYFLGGRIADKKPDFAILAAIATLAGLYVTLVVPYLGFSFCKSFSTAVKHPMLGPLLACTILYFLPTFLMAMVSPFALRLRATSLANLGGVAGRVSLISTAGSFVGTFLTAFFFIPNMTVTLTMQLLGGMLVVAALLGLVLFKKFVASAPQN